MKSMHKGPKSTSSKKAMQWQGSTPEKAPMMKKTSGVGKSVVGRGSATAKFNRGK